MTFHGGAKGAGSHSGVEWTRYSQGVRRFSILRTMVELAGQKAVVVLVKPEARGQPENCRASKGGGVWELDGASRRGRVRELVANREPTNQVGLDKQGVGRR